jgi:hemerythrin superfamily protein
MSENHETISEAIGADHDNFDVYYQNIKSAPDDGEKVRWRNQLTWIVARHAISEELTWYPAMEKHLGEEGVKLSKTDKEQHSAVCDHVLEHLQFETDRL